VLFSIAYRMLGSVMDAEDVVQEAFVRWQRAPQAEVRSPRAYPAVVTRLCVDQLRSAKAQREEYVGPWLPEPLPAEPAPDAVAVDESLSMAFLVLLESLNPTERAVSYCGRSSTTTTKRSHTLWERARTTAAR
jgi:RNA polymerase sigma-70 factor (ECF subfamily)